MRAHTFTVAFVFIGIVTAFRISVPGSRPFRGYSHKSLTREPTSFIHQTTSSIARPKFATLCGKGVTTNAAHFPSKYSIQSLFHKIISAISDFLVKFKSQQSQRKHNSGGKEKWALKGPSTSTFISAPSIPINKIVNLSSGRQYAEAKLQEIDSYFKRVGKGKSSPTVAKMPAANCTAELNITKQQVLRTYERKCSVLDIPDEALKGKRVLLRCNLDVPVRNGTVTEDSHLRHSLPTIHHLTKNGAKVILVGHRGQPAGQGYEAEYSLAPVATRLGEILNQTVTLVLDCIGVAAERAVAGLSEGGVVLLENLHFHAEEAQNDAEFVKNLTAHVDIFVNDDLSSAHVALASTQGAASLVPTAVTGLALQRDFEAFNATCVNLGAPLVSVVSVGNLSSQMPFLEKLIAKADRVVFTGPLAVSLQHACGNVTAAHSFAEPTELEVELARRLHQVAADHRTRLELIPDVKNVTLPYLMEETVGNGTLLWAGAEENRPDNAFMRVTMGQFNHTFSSYENAMEMIKGSALPGIIHLNKHES